MTFVDTGCFVALLIPLDQWHKTAVKLYEPGDVLVTSAAVIGETVSLLQKRGYLSLALEFLAQVRGDAELRIVHPDATMQNAAWDEFKRSGGFGANAVDCLSFAIMRKLGIKRAHTFDKHFESAGFETARKGR